MFLIQLKKWISEENKSIDKLLGSGISNIYLKVATEKNWRFRNFDFLS